MLKFRLSDHESHGDGITCTMIAENVPENLVQYAKDIDDDNYCPSCFVTQITYYDDEDQFRVDTGTPDGREFAYVDADGNWLGLDYEFSDEEIDQLVGIAKDVIKKQSIDLEEIDYGSY